jgi:hypothetical protein
MSSSAFDEDAFAAHSVCIDAACSLMEHGEFAAALAELDVALSLFESPHARWDRALTLLALGRYTEAWEDYRVRWQLFGSRITTPRGEYLRNVLPPWNGEALDGRRLVVIHEAGFGDTIMLLRFVPFLQGEIALVMPPELERLASQFASLLDEESERDVHCFTFDLPRLLGITVNTVPSGAYIAPDRELQRKWRDRLDGRARRKIGVVWSTTRPAPWRNIALETLREWLDWRYPNHEAISLQQHDHETAIKNGVVAFEFSDFADVAACASLMDSVVSIDTAALHVVGAIGHRDVTALLPDLTCWRWRCGSPWYPRIKLSRLSTSSGAR